MRDKKGGCSNFVTLLMAMNSKLGLEELSLLLSLALNGANAKTCLLEK